MPIKKRVETRQRNMRSMATALEPMKPIEWASEKQREVFEYGPFPTCASGGFGSSKSWSLSMKVLYLLSTYENNRGIIARREFETLKHTTMATFFKICPPQWYNEGGKRSDSEKYLRLNNGSELLWMHMDDPETENVVRGLEINFFFIDQAEEVEEEMFNLLMSRLGRWDRAKVPEWLLEMAGGVSKWPWKNPAGSPIVPIYALLACNPDTEMHWIYRQFHPDSEEHRRHYKQLGYKMWTMRSDENKFLPKQNLDTMLRNDKSFVRRFVYGEWGIPEGTIHTVDRLSLLNTDSDAATAPERGVPVNGDQLLDYLRQFCSLHRVLDHGDSSPTCVLWYAVDKDGNMFFFREYYEPGKLISDHRKAITELSAGETYRSSLADPSIFFKTSQKHGGMWSVNDEYLDRRHGQNTVIAWSPADNNELGTRNRINEYLRVDPDRIHPITKQKGSPRLFLVTRSDAYPLGCYHAVRELRAQRREKIGTDMGRPVFSDERDKSISDHSYDNLRYSCASRPSVASSPQAGVNPNSWNAIAAETDRWRRKGGPILLARRQRQFWKKTRGAA